MEQSAKGVVDYERVLVDAASASCGILEFLLEELPYLWRDAYLEMTLRPTDIVRWRRGSFEYIYDDYASLEASGAVPNDPQAEARLVAALGRSEPTKSVRDDYRLRGWVGATEKMFGPGWDKGHFIAHTIGGAVDGLEANVFVQRRDLNRGWSAEGRRFRQMEKYCVSNPGTFCFSRPLYLDQTAKPSYVEFGVLKSDGSLWAQRFDNR
ncbi:MAG: hypothetical protein JST79_10725 [Acidobacteria bacterium]|nr:hypothetical protein [Acidobacteriota bacterium]